MLDSLTALKAVPRYTMQCARLKQNNYTHKIYTHDAHKNNYIKSKHAHTHTHIPLKLN